MRGASRTRLHVFASVIVGMCGNIALWRHGLQTGRGRTTEVPRRHPTTLWRNSATCLNGCPRPPVINAREQTTEDKKFPKMKALTTNVARALLTRAPRTCAQKTHQTTPIAALAAPMDRRTMLPPLILPAMEDCRQHPSLAKLTLKWLQWATRAMRTLAILTIIFLVWLQEILLTARVAQETTRIQWSKKRPLTLLVPWKKHVTQWWTRCRSSPTFVLRQQTLKTPLPRVAGVVGKCLVVGPSHKRDEAQSV